MEITNIGRLAGTRKPAPYKGFGAEARKLAAISWRGKTLAGLRGLGRGGGDGRGQNPAPEACRFARPPILLYKHNWL